MYTSCTYAYYTYVLLNTSFPYTIYYIVLHLYYTHTLLYIYNTIYIGIKKLKIVFNDLPSQSALLLASSSTSNTSSTSSSYSSNKLNELSSYLTSLLASPRQGLNNTHTHNNTHTNNNTYTPQYDDDMNDISYKDDDLELKVLLTNIKMISNRLLLHKKTSYPFDTVRKDCRRPTFYERYWLLHLCIILGTGIVSKEVIIMTGNGSFQRFIHSTYITLSKQIHERIVEPVSDLFSELFQTISRRKEGIVTREDLEQSQQALNRMLEVGIHVC